MTNDTILSLIKHKIQSNGFIELTICGNSMNPVLKDHQSVTIGVQEEYHVGDVLIYKYKNEGLLSHRLLEIKNELYCCKGDNCYRMEEILKTDIYGKVMNIPEVDAAFIEMSIGVNREFVKNNSDFEKTINSELYKSYKALYLER